MVWRTFFYSFPQSLEKSTCLLSEVEILLRYSFSLSLFNRELHDESDPDGVLERRCVGYGHFCGDANTRPEDYWEVLGDVYDD